MAFRMGKPSRRPSITCVDRFIPFTAQGFNQDCNQHRCENRCEDRKPQGNTIFLAYAGCDTTYTCRCRICTERGKNYQNKVWHKNAPRPPSPNPPKQIPRHNPYYPFGRYDLPKIYQPYGM
ncbi:hypothetical protein KSP40_PGU004691 [Platanthera guangdongensis]|uniref:Uncharacterized protein n=1 Tax=Platanthera guangdongensis TaxID=2320717 RepID=A0ABR2LI87_9ASPA